MSDREKTVLALGFFDSVHIGHRRVLLKAKEQALKNKINCTAFTFDGNLKGAFFKGEKFVYSSFEREKIIKNLGIEKVYFAPLTKEFLGMDKIEFLDYMNSNFGIEEYVFGEDYTFGKNAEGNLKTVKEYADKKGQKVTVVETVKTGDKKVSTTLIKELIKKGDIEKANSLLDRSFSVYGEVFKDREVGKTLGFRTANIEYPIDKVELKFGVYSGRVEIKDREYKAVINYGTRPTFDDNKSVVETHILDFNSDIYGENITVYFDKYLRDIVKFKDIEELKNQLKKDVERVKGL